VIQKVFTTFRPSIITCYKPYFSNFYSDSDLQRRRELYGRNEFPEPERTTWLQMFIASFNDTTLIVLIVAAVVSLAVGKIIVFVEDGFN
jgi:magnesium-transporting ATPase (P-type)